MNSMSQMKGLADKDKTNFIAAFFHHVDIVFSILSLIVFFENGFVPIIGVALTLFILERAFQFFYTGFKTYKWQQALISLIYLDYLAQMCKREEGRGLQLFKKKYIRVQMISSPFALLCFYTFFEADQDQSLVLACGLIHLLNTAHANQEYYSQNILTIGIKQKNYIFLFVACEYFYRLVFLTYFKTMIGDIGIIGYMVAEFIVYYLLEFILSKREGQEKSYWIQSTLQKAWASVFYFRLEDTIVHDADEWNSESRNLDNYRQQKRSSNNFKSFRSKLYITLRLLENIFLTAVGVLQYYRIQEFTVLFALTIALLPFYIIWHVRYYRVNYHNQQQNNLNNSIAADAMQPQGKNFKHDKQTINQPNLEQTEENTPSSASDKFRQRNGFNGFQAEYIYGSNQRKLKTEENRPQHTQEASPPDSQYRQRAISNNNFNQNMDIEAGQLNGIKKQSNNLQKQSNYIQKQQSNLQKQQLNGQRSRKFSIQNQKQNKIETKKMQKLEDEQDYDDDDPYGQADVNAFSIE